MMQAQSKVAVVIPFYRASVTAFEQIALQQCLKVLGNYPIIAIKPKSLSLPNIAGLNFADVISFNEMFFRSKKGYNALMLSDSFYKAFLDYEYILIYQLDAFVFRDELSYWCNGNYDYIGAPWLRKKDYSLLKAKFYALKHYTHRLLNLKQNGVPTMNQFYNQVGNGGLSLRRVEKFYELSIQYKDKIAGYLNQQDDRYNEDAFWSIEVNRHGQKLNIPHYRIASKFAVEFEPVRALKLNEGKLPFGCHAWELYLDFWRPYFKEQGYIL